MTAAPVLPAPPRPPNVSVVHLIRTPQLAAAGAPSATAEANEPETPLEWALFYARRGYRVFPIHAMVQGPNGALRCACGKKCDSPGKHPRTPNGLYDATAAEAAIRSWWTERPGPNVAIRTGDGCLVLDVDVDKGGEESLDALTAKHGELPDTRAAVTGSGGRHVWFELPKGISLPCSNGTLGYGLDTRADGGYVLVPPSNHRSGGVYTWDGLQGFGFDVPVAPVPAWLLNLLKEAQKKDSDESWRQVAITVNRSPVLPPELLELIETDSDLSALWNLKRPDLVDLDGSPNLSRYDLGLANRFINAGFDDQRVADILIAFRLKHGNPKGKGYRLDYLQRTIATAHETPVTAGAGRPNTQPAEGGAPAVSSMQAEKPDFLNRLAPYPGPMSEEAFYGLTGRFVDLVLPHTEADPCALVNQFLTYFGCIIGRTAYTPVGADQHFTNLFVVEVGPTNSGRKGSSHSPVQLIFEDLEKPYFVPDRIASGLSTGEGLIHQIRDPVEARVKGKKGEETVEVDPGVPDKRVLFYEAEFASALAAMRRQGNTLSPIIRRAWDSPSVLQMATKKSPSRATSPHVSIIANITKQELRRCLEAEEALNGFANRFMWFCVRRSKPLPEGGRLFEARASKEFIQLQNDIAKAIHFAQNVKRMQRDGEASDLWGYDDHPHGAYEALTQEAHGLFGSATARAAPNVIRLSMIYALLDQSPVVRKEHLLSALEVWRYSSDSARYLFGDALGDPVADQILQELRRRAPDGLTRTEIVEQVFQRNKRSEEIARALSVLHDRGLARFETCESKGRATQTWFAVGGPFTEREDAI